MNSLTDSQLKTASIIDLTDDLDLMRSALEIDDFEIGDISGYSTDGKMFSLFSFAEYTSDTDLLKRLEKLFEGELAAVFNE